ncbi:hypothetical protein [Acinetobacter stercoris]|uniref:Uncharacterized protein n=1 Tax=Acinetobacter stercoris TaxID=2126983 RepID=A0A2U3N242_9GAMM|nr:hypothetical protein [Acinetobacter stercoris]SPL71760.1 hypothetical protein KPC_2938 [Acinetobacter stercoris]
MENYLRITFEQLGDFEAYHSACNWCDDNGFSHGSMARDMPIGILKGDWSIAKWYNLTHEEREQLDGFLESPNFHEGPVFIVIKNEEAI